MELNLSPSAATAMDSFRQSDARASLGNADAEVPGGGHAPDEAETLEAKVASGDGDEQQPRQSAVDSDTGQNLDISV